MMGGSRNRSVPLSLTATTMIADGCSICRQLMPSPGSHGIDGPLCSAASSSPRGLRIDTLVRARRVKISLTSRDVVAKLRLDGTPTPRSWVARMTKRLTPNGVGKSASPREA